MAVISTSAIQWARTGVDLVVKQYREDDQMLYKQMVAMVEDNGQLFQRLGTFQTLPVAQEVDELEGIPTGNFTSSYTKDYYYYKRGMSILISKEAIERDARLKKVYKDIPGHILNSIRYAMEYDVAGQMNNATVSTAPYGTPDGVAFASASHPVLTGLDSNYVSGALNITVLESMIQTIMQQKNQNGDTYLPAMMGGYTLWVHPSQWALANRLVEARGYPDSITTGRYNDPNVAAGMITGVKVNPFFTSPTAAIALPNSEDLNPLFMAIQSAPSADAHFIPQMDGVWTGGRAIWLSGARDYRNSCYTPGS